MAVNKDHKDSPLDRKNAIGLVFRKQAEWCRKLDSALYATILESAAENADGGGIVAELLAPYINDPLESALALRLLAAVHRVALRGDAPSLAAIYPSCGGNGNRLDAWAAFLETIIENFDELQSSTGLSLQTNEVNRSAVLLGGFLLVAERTRLPLRIFEIGASAGLNLRWDHFRYVADDWQWGLTDAQLVYVATLRPVHPRLRMKYRLSSGVDATRPLLTQRRSRANGCSRHLSGPINSCGSTTLSEHAKSR